jgi:hypothetical protein
MKSKTASVDEIRATRLITAIKTPYLANGKVDLSAYDSLVEKQISAGVGGLIVGGTTGEGQLMSWDEHIMLIAHTAKLYGDQLQVIGNTGSNSTKEAVHATSQGFAVGGENFRLFFLKPQPTFEPLISSLRIFFRPLRLRYGCGSTHQSLLWENLKDRSSRAL